MASGKKYNVYITDDNQGRWEKLPSRSGWVNKKLKEEQAEAKEEMRAALLRPDWDEETQTWR